MHKFIYQNNKQSKHEYTPNYFYHIIFNHIIHESYPDTTSNYPCLHGFVSKMFTITQKNNVLFNKFAMKMHLKIMIKITNIINQHKLIPALCNPLKLLPYLQNTNECIFGIFTISLYHFPCFSKILSTVPFSETALIESYSPQCCYACQ